MVLCVDAGNTNIVLGGYEGQTLAFLSRIATQPALEADQYELHLEGVLALHAAARPQGAILSSVVPPVTGALRGALHLLCGAQPLVLSRALCPRLPILIDNPDELGADLLAGAIAARARCRMPAVVIDMGTATKLTALDAAGAVQGVSILPGMMVSLNALISGASQLSAVATQAPAHAIGKNTAESIQSGIVLGTADLLDGMLARFEAELGGPADVVATGGLAGLVVPHCRRSIPVVPHLLLDGLYEVYRRHTGLSGAKISE